MSNPSLYPLGVTQEELEADVRRTLRRFFYALSGDAPPDLVPRLFKEQSATGVLERMPEPDELPAEANVKARRRAIVETPFDE